jgi:uncharacterized protein (DUF2141 family)/hypothetical membrane protein
MTEVEPVGSVSQRGSGCPDGATGLAAWLARGSVASLVLFSVAWTALGLVRPGYSCISQPISGLGVGPHASVMNFAFVLSGLLTLAGSVGTFLLIREVSMVARWSCVALLALSGVGSVLCGLYTWESFAPHMIGSILGLAGPILGFLVGGVVLRRIPRWSRMGGWLLGGAAMTLLLVALFFATFSVQAVMAGRGLAGLIERVLVAQIQALYAALAMGATRQGAPTSGRREPRIAGSIAARLALACFVLFPGVPAPLAQPADSNLVHVEITALRSSSGRVLCSLFSSADGFPGERDKAEAVTTSTISDQRAVCEFPGRVDSTYAVAVVHDENGNGELDRGFLGIPREGVGASNNARGRAGPPKFAAAAFRFSGGRLALEVAVDYF